MRTAIYVDGFNLFHSLLEGRKGKKWLDLKAMAAGALQPHNEICLVRYFTARVSGTEADPDIPSRQDVYLRALNAQGIIVHFGNFTERAKTRRLVDPPAPPASKYAEVWHREEKAPTSISPCIFSMMPGGMRTTAPWSSPTIPTLRKPAI